MVSPQKQLETLPIPEEGWTTVGRKCTTGSQHQLGPTNRADPLSTEAPKPPKPTSEMHQNNLQSTEPTKDGSKDTSAPKNYFGSQQVMAIPRIADRLPTSFEVTQFPSRLNIIAPLNNPGKDRYDSPAEPTSIVQTASKFYADVAAICQTTNETIAAIFKFPRWEYNKFQENRSFVVSVRHDSMAEASSILKTLATYDGSNFEAQWVINETIANSLPLERSLRMSLLLEDMTTMDQTELPRILHEMHSYWIQRGASAVKLQRHRPRFPSHLDHLVPLETAHLVVVFPQASSVFIALCMEVDAKGGFISCSAASEGRRKWFSVPHSTRMPRQTRPVPCSKCLLTDHHSDLCPGIKRCNLSLRPLPDNDARITFVGSVVDMLQQKIGAPEIEVVTDEQGNLRDFCRLNFNSVEATAEALDNNLVFTTTDTEARHVLLKIFPITGCTRCLLNSHRGSPCPTPHANDPLPRPDHRQQPPNGSHLPRSTQWGNGRRNHPSYSSHQPKSDVQPPTQEQQEGSKPSMTQDKPSLQVTSMVNPYQNNRSLALSKAMSPSSSRTRSQTRDKKKAEQSDHTHLRKRADSCGTHCPTQQVNILDFLKPTPKPKLGSTKNLQHSDPLHPTPVQPAPADKTRGSQSDTADHTALDDPMDESTGMDHHLREIITRDQVEIFEDRPEGSVHRNCVHFSNDADHAGIKMNALVSLSPDHNSTKMNSNTSTPPGSMALQAIGTENLFNPC
jgi:hypothetical protein